jgi:hypothetical protein
MIIVIEQTNKKSNTERYIQHGVQFERRLVAPQQGSTVAYNTIRTKILSFKRGSFRVDSSTYFRHHFAQRKKIKNNIK